MAEKMCLYWLVAAVWIYRMHSSCVDERKKEKERYSQTMILSSLKHLRFIIGIGIGIGICISHLIMSYFLLFQEQCVNSFLLGFITFVIVFCMYGP